MPVAPKNLEDCLPDEWWKTLFNETYLKTDGDIIENEANTVQDVDLLLALLDLNPAQSLLDLCCGQGRHCIELGRRGYRVVTGLDYSDILLKLARQRAADADLPIRFVQGDARSPRFEAHSFDAILCMGNSFGYFSDDRDDLLLVRRFADLLGKGGQLFLDLSDGEAVRGSFEAQSSEWLDGKTLVKRERTLSRSGKRLISREILYHRDDGLLADQVYAETLYSDSDISSMLREAGFGSVRVHREYPVLSTRNEDLGMLAHRMIITASLKWINSARGAVR